MSQKNQGNSQSKKQGADHGKPGRTETVSSIERVGSKSGGHSFEVPNHPEHCNVRGPGGKMDH